MGGIPGVRVGKTGQEATVIEVPQPRCFHSLIVSGKQASDKAWNDPLQALYHYSPAQRSPKPLRLREQT